MNMNPEVEVNMKLASSSPKFNTDGRTDERTKKLVAYVDQSSVCNAGGVDDFASIGDVIEAGLWPTGERHPVIRQGERAEIPKHTRIAIWYRDDGRCRLCRSDEPRGGEYHLDHIKPWSAGGSDLSDNLRVLCAKHNMERGNQITPDERPEIAVTWWCERCYMRDEHSWDYSMGLPICPIHHLGRGARYHCPVQRLYKKAFEETGEWPTWHQREHGLTELYSTAYCAHCNLRGMTGVTL